MWWHSSFSSDDILCSVVQCLLFENFFYYSSIFETAAKPQETIISVISSRTFLKGVWICSSTYKSKNLFFKIQHKKASLLSLIVNKFDGLIGLTLFPSFSSSTVSMHEFIIASTTAIKTERASSLRLSMREQNVPCWSYLSLEYSTHVITCMGVFNPHQPICSFILQKVLVFGAIKGFVKFTFCSNEITSIITSNSLNVSSSCYNSLKCVKTMMKVSFYWG